MQRTLLLDRVPVVPAEAGIQYAATSRFNR
jgi:hypothetical protein